MYRQIKVNPNHQFSQNILWREKPTDPLQFIELQTVTYGTNSAPFLATGVLLEIASKNETKFALACNAILIQCERYPCWH